MNIYTLLFSLLLCWSTNVNAIYSGYVYVDGNENNVRDEGERFLEGVVVSDGLHTVKTDKNGLFNLPGYDKTRFIFITTPSGYKTNNRHYLAVKDGGDGYNFGLQEWNGRVNKDGSHKFIQISDTEIFSLNGCDDWVNNVKDYVRDNDVAFVIHTGDICYEFGLREHLKLMNTENMKCPMFYSTGNHDLIKGEYGEAYFESIYGPVYYSFDVGNIHYVVTPMAFGDYASGYTAAEVSRWLKNDLAMLPPNKTIIVFNHDMLTGGEEFIYGEKDENINLNDYNLKAYLSGHRHSNFMRKQGTVTAIQTGTLDKGGIDHSLNAFRVLSIDKNDGVSSNLRYTYVNKSIQIASIGASTRSIWSGGVIPVSVNAYHSSQINRIEIECSLDSKPIGKRIRLTQNTDWNWSGNISVSDKYLGKQLVVKAKAIAANGEEFEDVETFIYHAPKGAAERLQSEEIMPVDSLYSTRLLWATNLKGNIMFTPPLAINKMVYMGTTDDNLRGEGGVHALDAATGQLKWSFRTRNSVKNTIAYDQGTIFAQDTEGYLYAIDAITGKLKWEKGINLAGRILQDGLTVSAGILYAGSGKGFSAIDTKTGDVIWQNTMWAQGEGTTSTVMVTPDRVITGSNWNGLYGHDLRTGQLVWMHNKNGIIWRGATPSVKENIIYVLGDVSLFLINASTGNLILRHKLPYNVNATSKPIVTDDLIIFGTTNHGLVCLNREDLTEKWRTEVSESLLCSSPYTRSPVRTIETNPVMAGEVILFGAADGLLYTVDKQTGNILWKHSVGAPIFSSVAVSGNSFYAADFGGNVYHFTSKYLPQ